MGNAVNNAEIDRFGMAADVGRHLFPRQAEDLHGGRGMNVDAGGKASFKAFTSASTAISRSSTCE